MKIKVAQNLSDINGEPLIDSAGTMTLRQVLQNVLLNSLPGDEALSGEDKVILWNLAQDTRSDEVDWAPENIVRAKARIGKGYGPLIVGQVFEMLDV